MTIEAVPALLPWLRRVKAIEVVYRHGADGGFEVWATNGQAGYAREGRILADCEAQLDAELIAYALRKELDA